MDLCHGTVLVCHTVGNRDVVLVDHLIVGLRAHPAAVLELTHQFLELLSPYERTGRMGLGQVVRILLRVSLDNLYPHHREPAPDRLDDPVPLVRESRICDEGTHEVPCKRQQLLVLEKEGHFRLLVVCEPVPHLRGARVGLGQAGIQVQPDRLDGPSAKEHHRRALCVGRGIALDLVLHPVGSP